MCMEMKMEYGMDRPWERPQEKAAVTKHDRAGKGKRCRWDGSTGKWSEQRWPGLWQPLLSPASPSWWGNKGIRNKEVAMAPAPWNYSREVLRKEVQMGGKQVMT